MFLFLFEFFFPCLQAQAFCFRFAELCVETVEEWQMLAELGCQLAQGFLISPAVPGEQLLAGIAEWRAPDPLIRKS